MKLHHPILLLSLSLASALTLLADATPIALSDTHPTSIAATSQQQQQQQQQQKQHSTQHTGMITRRRSKHLVKRAPPSPPVVALPKYRALKQKSSSTTDTSTTSSSIPKTPLLLLPDSRSVWQTGSYQTVKWSKKYAKSFPKDTTVDIILVDASTNRKVHSLKRFIPFKKGSAQVLVPAKMPEGVNFVLVLELYRGRSQEQVITNTTEGGSSSHGQGVTGQGNQVEKVAGGVEDNSNYSNLDSSSSSSSHHSSGDVFSTVVRRSDISISSGARKIARDTPYPDTEGGLLAGTSNNPAGLGAGAGIAGSHHDINNDDYYAGAITEHGLEFLPDEMREEYPNTVRPLELEHTFGLHQKVYTLTPYTLEWKIPERIAELLEYTRQVQLSANTWAKNNNAQGRQQIPPMNPKSTFLAKVLVELVVDQTMETISVLARDIPAETMFQYLSIQDRIPQAFYRLRVQMVVVQVKVEDLKKFAQEQAALTGGAGGKAKNGGMGMEGWEFPSGGEVIDRYEAVTRRFWVSQGAL